MREDTPVIGYLHYEYVLKVDRLNKLKDVFNAVRSEYDPIEKGLLITAYKRKIGK